MEREPPIPSQNRARRKRTRRIIPFAIVLVFALFIVRDQVPFVRDLIDKTLHPNEWRAQQVCKGAALDSASKPDFARIIERGEVSKTQNGYYVSGIIVGDMSEDGGETRFDFSCYVDSTGRIANTNRLRGARP